MTQLQLLESTINYFNSENLCSKNGACFYTPISDKTEGCAIGRHLSDEAKKAFDGYMQGDTIINKIFEDDLLKEMAPNWMQEMDVSFLVALQRLHDFNTNWDENGLSGEGKQEVMKIKKQFKLDEEEKDKITK